MACSECGDKPKKDNGFTKAVVEINNETLILFRKVVIPASMGDESEFPAEVGKFRNVLLVYSANGHAYLYSSDGIPTQVTTSTDELERLIGQLRSDLTDESNTRENTDRILQQEITDLKNSPDVVDIVATYAALMAYDTSGLGDKDIIRVLTDETHDDKSTYYRWNLSSQTWTYIGAIEGYYTKAQIDTMLAGKQDVLTAGSNISIEEESGALVISATDTTYSAGTGLDLTGTTFSVDTDTIATKTDLDGKQDILTAGDNITIEDESGALVISATDTTYSAFSGADGTNAGSAGLVPAPAATDNTKYLKGDGTWATVSAGPTVVQATGTSTTDVMSQNATTDMVYADPGTNSRVRIGTGASVGSASSGSPVAIGKNASAATDAIAIGGATASSQYTTAIGPASTTASGTAALALGYGAKANYARSIAMPGATTSAAGEFNIMVGNSSATSGYNSSAYRLLTGLYDPQSAHDAATKGYVDTALDGKQDALTAGEGITIEDESGALVISATGGGGGGGMTELPASGYNWPSDSPDGIALWTLDPGVYYLGTGAKAYYSASGSSTTTSDIFIVGEASNGMVQIIRASATNSDFKRFNINTTTGSMGVAGSLITNIVQATGTSQTDVMSQNAVTSMVYADPGARTKIQIGANSNAGTGSNGVVIGQYAKTGTGSINNAVAIGANSSGASAAAVAVGYRATVATSSNGGIAIGNEAEANAFGSIALGQYSTASSVGEMNIGSSDTTRGYNSSNYRLLTGLYDGQSAHDAATVGQLDEKQDLLTPGEGITIAEESGALVISATGGGGGVETISSQDWSALWQ